MRSLLYKFIFSGILLVSINLQAQCPEGQMGVFITVHTVNSGPQVSWELVDADGVVLAEIPTGTYASNFTYDAYPEVCLDDDATYTFNTFDSGNNGWGPGAWYAVSTLCGGDEILIDNNGNQPSGSGNTESFDVPEINSSCDCFSVSFETTSASTATAPDGSATAIVYGGVGVIEYAWDGIVGSDVLSGLVPGDYSFEATDEEGCTVSGMVEVQGPSIFMGNLGTIEACTGYFYDSGGANNIYGLGQNYTVTLCSGEPLTSTALTFHDFDLGNNTTFTVYDGNSTAAPILYLYNSNGDPDPTIIQATSTNTSGCLTVSFSSPFGNSSGAGWWAEIDCQFPCQDFDVTLLANDPINADNEIEVCYELELEAVTNYFDNNVFYDQSDETSTFEWAFIDGDVTQFGQEVMQPYTIDEMGSTALTLTVTDENGCFEILEFTVINENPEIITSIIPPLETQICPGTVVQVGSGNIDPSTGEVLPFVDPIEWDFLTPPPGVIEYADPIYLPDGSGVSYTTEMFFGVFDENAVLAADGFVEICMEIEHSYLGDLDATITGPDGTEVTLFTQSGGGTWLGNAIDNNSDEVPGDCWEYCWSMDADFGTFGNSGGNTMTAPNGGQAMISGIYTPQGDFSNFTGESANGVWTLTITDNLFIDNGFICSWAVELVAELANSVPGDTIIPEVLSYSWLGTPEPGSVLTYDDYGITVQPTAVGTHTYEMSVIDNFGCEYNEEFTLDVWGAPQAAADDVIFCIDECNISVGNVPPAGGVWSWSGGPSGAGVDFAPSATDLNPTVTVSALGNYSFVFTDLECGNMDSQQINFVNIEPTIAPPAVQYCTYEVDLFVDNASANGGIWQVVDQPLHSTVDLTATGLNDLEVAVDEFGTYQLSYTIDVCNTSDTVNVNFAQVAPQIFSEELIECQMETGLSVTSQGLDVGWGQQNGPSVAYFSDPFDIYTTVEIEEYGEYTLSYSACDTTVYFNVLFMCDLVLPNVISPNGDSQNENMFVKRLTTEFYSHSNMSIYNRWGQEVYHNGNYGLDGTWWKGTDSHEDNLLPDGVYYYVLVVANKVTKEEEVYTGSVHLFAEETF
jgi:gliding motility-associated-like protein